MITHSVCMNCGKKLRIKTASRFCRKRCEREFNGITDEDAPLMDDGASAAIRTNKILALHDELERTNVAWMRAEILLKLDALKNERT